MTRRAPIALLAILLAACAPTPVEVDLAFPREENFLYSDFGRLLVYTVDPEMGLDVCPALLERINAGNFGEPLFDSDRQPICAFTDGGVVFGDMPPGPHAYIALASDEGNRVLLTGCRVAEVYADAPQIEVFMYPTLDYTSAIAGRALTCGDAAAKCAGGCR
jgi:hypothetical protein